MLSVQNVFHVQRCDTMIHFLLGVQSESMTSRPDAWYVATVVTPENAMVGAFPSPEAATPST